MRSTPLVETVALGAMTGMRSMSGAATFARRHGGLMGRVMPVLAAGEMIADKTPWIGDRLDPAPLAGRAIIGAVVGGLLARETDRSPWAGALVGGTAAVAAAHVAFRARKRLPLPPALGGMLEDLLVMGIGALYACEATPNGRRGAGAMQPA